MWKKKGDLNDFEYDTVVGISETADLLVFSSKTIFTENGPKKGKYPVSLSSVDENTLLMPEVRGE